MAQTAHFKSLQTQSNNHIQNQHKDVETVTTENSNLKKLNLLLKNQLHVLSQSRAGKTRYKISQKTNKTRQNKSRQEQVGHMQLKNAYKQCNIYKRQANFYRKKVISYEANQKSSEINEWRTNQLQKQNNKLREQIKYLIKINKKQEKGLQSTGVGNYLTNVKETQKMQQQIRKLKKQNSIYEKQALKKLQSHQNLHQKSRHHTIVGVRQPQKKNKCKQRIKSSQSNFQTSSQFQLNQKMEKNQLKIKIKVLQQQKQQYRMQINHYKEEILLKNKQISMLRQKIKSLRNTNQLLVNSVSQKTQYKEKLNLPSMPYKYKRVQEEQRSFTKSQPQNKVKCKQFSHQALQTFNHIKYWSHVEYASKMIEFHVVIHQKGHIKDINAKYQKGQPQSRKYFGHRLTHKSLICAQGEYIKHISGCFCDNYLQCLAIVTSQKRLQTFGNAYLLQLNEQCDKFEFSLESPGHIGILKGENSQQGITKLDCLMIKIP